MGPAIKYGEGEYKTEWGGGGQVRFYPYKNKGGGQNKF